ncbi:MAG: (2Fe-2S) ferredoxin domain-containing protein [Candidatus Eremiobacterota bacterium]
MSEPRPLEGRFLGFRPSSTGEEPDSFWLKTLAVVERIFVAPAMVEPLRNELVEGQRVRVWVELSPKGRWKARVVVPLEAPLAWNEGDPGQLGCIQVCLHKNCRNRGARELRAALQRYLAEHPQQDRIRLEAVGCMDECKKGPNVRLLPSGKVYHRMSAIAGVALVHRTFPCRSEAPATGPVPVNHSSPRTPLRNETEIPGGIPQG